MSDIQQHTPHAGDVIRLMNDWYEAKAGQYAVIGGMADEDMTFETGEITFRASSFNDGRRVSCSGGPGTIGGVPTAQLHWTGETRPTRFWKWKDGYPGADRGVDYVIEVPVWEWHGTYDYWKEVVG